MRGTATQMLRIVKKVNKAELTEKGENKMTPKKAQTTKAQTEAQQEIKIETLLSTLKKTPEKPYALNLSIDYLETMLNYWKDKKQKSPYKFIFDEILAQANHEPTQCIYTGVLPLTCLNVNFNKLQKGDAIETVKNNFNKLLQNYLLNYVSYLNTQNNDYLHIVIEPTSQNFTNIYNLCYELNIDNMTASQIEHINRENGYNFSISSNAIARQKELDELKASDSRLDNLTLNDILGSV